MSRRDTHLKCSCKRETLSGGQLMHRVGFSTLIVLYAFVVIACTSGRTLPQTGTNSATEVTVEANAEVASDTPQSVPKDTPMTAAVATVAPTVEPPATDTVAPPTETPLPVATPAALFYNLPQAKLTSATGLYASPNRAEFIVPVTIPQGETIYIMGRNATNSHLRAVWNTGVGWVPVSFTDFNGQRDRLQDLPVFEQEPPACAEPITTQFGFNSEWTSDKRQRIAVVADLFRSKYGPFPDSSLSLKVNSVEVESSRRPIVENGQFSLKDVVFSPGQDLQAGETVGYILNTSSDEPLTFMATIFSIPQNCQWEID